MAQKKKSTRSREYTGPKTVSGVIAYLESNAYKRSKDQAVASLSNEDQFKVIEHFRHKLKGALAEFQEAIDWNQNQRN